ncbi:S9 family peptidase [Maricaulis maris]|uniref:Dipeptidyl aminopeptidase/acylaminoacyl peptidase n=1 Tax=Maricaulis maris TaxID=74318 RepID=A0A495DLD9_9PROT|nr:S9 family peptidase [Maricaulis maris]RKR03752.1 dipeptidyl aminopeptidase/acylaminoacyl peptidase [Maricaulis maris]
MIRSTVLASLAFAGWLSCALPQAAFALADDNRLVALNPAAATERRDMTPVDMIELPRLDGIRVSHDGRSALVQRVSTDWAEDENETGYWLWQQGQTGLVHQPDLDAADRVVFSPDGRRIAAEIAPEGSSNDEVYIRDLDGGELERLTRHPTAVRSITWSPDELFVYYIASDARSEAERERRSTTHIVDPYYESTRRRHLWRVRVDSGVRQQVTQGELHVRGYHLAANGAILVRVSTETHPDATYQSELMVAAGPSEPFRRVTSNNWPEANARLSPDGRRIAYRARLGQDGLDYVQEKLVVLDLEGGVTRVLAPDASWEVDGFAWLPGGASLVVAVRDGVRSGLVRVDVDAGSLTVISLEDRALVDWSLADETGEVLALFQTEASNGDLWRVTPDGESERLTTIGAATVSAFNRPQQQRVEWRSHDGAVIEGFYFPPLRAGDGPPPLVVQIHGGPRSSDQFGQWKWSRYVPVLAAEGYAVLWVNYRGGVGYGDEFMRGMHGEYFAHADRDVLTGVDHLLASGLADPDRMIISGWSAGGHMTNRLITQTDRFAAAMSGAGAVDWAVHHLTSDVRGARRLLFDADVWAEGAYDRAFVPQSLLRDLHAVTTPTLIFAGEDDERVHPSQSIMLYQALRNLGVEARFYLVPGEEHSFSAPRHRLFRLNAELDWYGRHTGGPDRDWQAPPVPLADD